MANIDAALNSIEPEKLQCLPDIAVRLRHPFRVMTLRVFDGEIECDGERQRRGSESALASG